ncbi:gluconate 5-dehydrogenase [Candidatus Phycosocius bacilliformis]|uniref:D-xylose 1-dehydrogenase n=1 Tax=Candidatus Phycosocius bacilliformis TaxID=1445552 RepID=A0A2P2EE81_9PROT|nr:SDR family NAD(P)-dependent oxidoreductase [Candidatus Phycosocius bacilliformis]GBF59373.1 gluconate 5-dehydrogenase [Candidatus Phycosocius bacilliformis]
MSAKSGLIQPDFRLDGKTALITGASSGLGAHFARLLAGLGAKVVCGARRRDRLDDLVAQIAANGGQAQAVVLDVQDEASVIAAFDAAEAGLGTPSIVIANAGVNEIGLATEISMDAYDAVMSVNVRGVFITAREAARRMIAAGSSERGDGRIVLIASMAGLKPLPGLVPYSVSKAAVVMMARSMAAEWMRKGINVSAICPGYIETEINSDWLNQPGGQKMVSGFPRRRIMDEEALDGAMAWLVSEAGRYASGSVIQIDDGQGL